MCTYSILIYIYTHVYTYVCVCVYIVCVYIHIHYALVAQMVKNLPAMKETQVWSLSQEDALEKEIIHSSILVWRISGQRSLAGCSQWSRKESDPTEQLTFSLSHILYLIFPGTYMVIYNYTFNIYFQYIFILIENIWKNVDVVYLQRGQFGFEQF